MRLNPGPQPISQIEHETGDSACCARLISCVPVRFVVFATPAFAQDISADFTDEEGGADHDHDDEAGEVIIVQGTRI